MRATSRLLGSLAPVLFYFPLLLGQTNPPHADPHELVTREPKVLTKTDERSSAIDVIDRVRKNFEIHDAKTPYALKVSFETNGATRLEGAGTMEEFYDGHGRYRWTALLGDVSVTRVKTDHRVYGTNASEPVPLRIQFIRAALLTPLLYNIAQF